MYVLLITRLLRGVGRLGPQTGLTTLVGSCRFSNWPSLVGPQSVCNRSFGWRFYVVTLQSSRSRSKSKWTHSKTPCPGGITALLPYLIWIIYFTIVVNDPRACYSPTLMSCLQGQGHSEHIARIHARAITALFPCWIWIFYRIVVHDPRVCINPKWRSYI